MMEQELQLRRYMSSLAAAAAGALLLQLPLLGGGVYYLVSVLTIAASIDSETPQTSPLAHAPPAPHPPP